MSLHFRFTACHRLFIAYSLSCQALFTHILFSPSSHCLFTAHPTIFSPPHFDLSSLFFSISVSLLSICSAYGLAFTHCIFSSHSPHTHYLFTTCSLLTHYLLLFVLLCPLLFFLFSTLAPLFSFFTVEDSAEQFIFLWMTVPNSPLSSVKERERVVNSPFRMCPPHFKTAILSCFTDSDKQHFSHVS